MQGPSYLGVFLRELPSSAPEMIIPQPGVSIRCLPLLNILPLLLQARLYAFAKDIRENTITDH